MALLEGLEISEISLSELERTLRIDSEFYKKINLRFLDSIVHKNPEKLTGFVGVSDGNHLSISDHFQNDGIPYYRGGDIYNFYIEQTKNPLHIPEKIYSLRNMERSHLKKGDVLISIVGAIIGNLSLVKTNANATCSCKLAILRPKSISPELLAVYLRSKFGQNQIQKFRRGTGQTGFILEDFDQILIPEFSDIFSKTIVELVTKSYESHENSIDKYSKAEGILLKELNLEKFIPSQEPVNVKSFADSFGSTGRLDAEYYQVKYDEILSKVKSSKYSTLNSEMTRIDTGEYAPEYFEKTEAEGLAFYIRSTNIIDGQIEFDDSYYVPKSQHTRFVKTGDIVTARVGSVGVFGEIRKELDGSVYSDNVLCFRLPDSYIPSVYTLLFNTGIYFELIDRLARGSVQQRLNQETLRDLIIPIIDSNKQESIALLIEESFELKNQSEHLLEVAKKAVELAIEEDEQTALDWIAEQANAWSQHKHP